MFQSFISIVIALFAYQALASTPECGTVLGESPFAKELDIRARVFDISSCESHSQAFEAVETWFNERSKIHGYEPNWFSYAISNMETAVVMMEEDHSWGDGESPWSEAAVDAVVKLYTSPTMHKDMWLGEYADNYMSGTGITGLIVLQTAEADKLIVIEKFLYAE